jgi:hypothetical protein
MPEGWFILSPHRLFIIKFRTIKKP